MALDSPAYPAPAPAPAYASTDRATPTPEVTTALHEFAEAGHQLAAASEALIETRGRHSEAAARYAHLQDQVSKLREQHGV